MALLVAALGGGGAARFFVLGGGSIGDFNCGCICCCCITRGTEELVPLELDALLIVVFNFILGRIGGRGEIERESSDLDGDIPLALAALSLLTLLSPTLCNNKAQKIIIPTQI